MHTYKYRKYANKYEGVPKCRLRAKLEQMLGARNFRFWQNIEIKNSTFMVVPLGEEATKKHASVFHRLEKLDKI